MPQYDILNIDKKGISLNDAFKDVYKIIIDSKGTYDALLGYVKNYNWSARDDGGYDCTTTIISLGEVLESLKCNWVPLETTAFDENSAGILKQNKPFKKEIINSYEQGIIPGLLHELWDYLDTKVVTSNLNYSSILKDPTYGTNYFLYMSKAMQAPDKDDRGGLPKPLSSDVKGTEGWITLGSFCDLLNNYVLLKDGNNQPLSQIITYQTDTTGSIIYEKDQFGNILPKSLECIASPLSLSTNLGVCLIRNDNWASLGIEQAKTEAATDQNNTKPAAADLPVAAIQSSIITGNFNVAGEALIVSKIVRSNFDNFVTYYNPLDSTTLYKYNGNLETDLRYIADQIVKGITKVELVDLKSKYTFFNGTTFTAKEPSIQTVNLFDYFFADRDEENKLEAAYRTLFQHFYKNEDGSTTDVSKDPFDSGGIIAGPTFFKDNTATKWSKSVVLGKIKSIFSQVPLNDKLRVQAQAQTSTAASTVNTEARQTAGLTSGTLQFLIPNDSLSLKTLGRISNIYVNINYLYSQAISKNVASNDNQNTNNISIREYLQGILNEIQNSIGNINDFDIQVDNRNAIGRIIDINFTGETTIDPFTLQIHNTNSAVRKYSFQSKIFPEMGSIIAISAQDATGIGKLGYDNATLVAWNEGITDRLIPKKDFSSDIQLSKGEDPASFILPFLTKMKGYFDAIQGQDTANKNFAFGGLNFAFRDFLANLSRFDPRNNFKTIIPTELNITLDGIGGIVIGNLFKINQDIVPKGYRNVPGRSLAYIVTKLGHSVSDNDWTTELGAYPIVFETAAGVNVAKKWKNQKYPGSVTITVGGRTIANIINKSTGGFNQSAIKTAMNFFISKGFSVEAAAALVGSFLQESQLSPTVININDNYAYNDSLQTYAAGIAQFVGPRRVELLKFAKSNGIDIPNYAAAVKIQNNSTKTPQSGTIIKSAFQNMTLDVQLNYVLKELSNYKGNQSFKTSTDLSSNILWVYEVYEGGNYTPGADIGSRGPWASDLVNRYKAGEFK
jgi:hypothetical protein